MDDFLKVVKRYISQSTQKSTGDPDTSDGLTRIEPSSSSAEDPDSESEIAAARWAWNWIRSHPEITISGYKRFDKLNLDEVLALPEELDPFPSAEDSKRLEGDFETQAAPSHESEVPQQSAKSKKSLTIRPRIRASEDLVWRTIAHHGIDYKRVPLKEWQCLLGVASAREQGILQGDLTRLTGQDKRSLPKRTDALATKGYIVKRTTVAKGVKTSRLWLVDSAPAMVQDNASVEIDLSEETLRANLDPVPWRDRWTGESIDMESLGRTLLAIIQAWKVMRYTDVKVKMGVTDLRWQMKVLANHCRRFVDMGILAYSAAALKGSNKIYKDCIKFLREPDPEEWEKFLATGKKTSKYSGERADREPKTNASSQEKKPLDMQDMDDDMDEENDVDDEMPRRQRPVWLPEKPLAGTVFDIVKSAGPSGISNPQVSAAAVGYQFHRFMGSHLTKIAEIQQPDHLKQFQVTSELVRTGKISGYAFAALGKSNTTTAQEGTAEMNAQRDENCAEVAAAGASSNVDNSSSYGFGRISGRSFAPSALLSLSELRKATGMHRAPTNKKTLHLSRGRKRRLMDNSDLAGMRESPLQPPSEDHDVVSGKEQDQDTARSTPQHTSTLSEQFKTPPVLPRGRGRPRTAQPEIHVDSSPLNGDVSTPGQGAEAQPDGVDSAIDGTQTLIAIEALPGKPPGAYVGTPGSLYPRLKKQGRPKRSCVVIFKFEPSRYRELLSSHLELSASQAGDAIEIPQSRGECTTDQTIVAEAGTAHQTSIIASSVQPESPADAGSSTASRGRGRGRKRGPASGSFKCETCGDVWKNDLGLRYHLTKSQTTCNPDYNPVAVQEEKRNRKRQRLVSPTPNPGSERGDPAEATASPSVVYEDTSPSRPIRGDTVDFIRTPIIRQARRPLQASTRGHRGLVVGDVRAAASKLAQELSEQDIGQTSRHRSQARSAQHDYRPAVPSRLGRGAEATEKIQMALTSSDPKDQDQDTLGINMTLAKTVPSSQLSPGPTSQSLPRSGKGVSQHVEVSPAGVTSSASTSLPLSTAAPNAAQAVRLSQDTGIIEAVAGSEQKQDQMAKYAEGEQFHMELRPFVPQRNYDVIQNEPKRRHAQASDIIHYILDNSNGVFPGDKSLYFALLRTFIDTFEGEAPLTWTHYQKVLRQMNADKEISTHVHLLRSEGGRMITYTIVVDPAVDPSGSVATSLKQNMRDAYPAIFIPQPFSFSDDELVSLEQLCNPVKQEQGDSQGTPHRHGPNFRVRRAQIEDVEVLDAPYYEEQLAKPRDTIDDVLGGSPAKKPSKRSAALLDNDQETKRQRTTNIPFPTHGSPKTTPMKRVSFIEPASSPQTPLAPDHESNDPEARRTPGTPKQASSGHWSAWSPDSSHEIEDEGEGDIRQLSRGKLSVAEAVKMYRLLPSKRKNRGTPRPKKLNKLPAGLGRSRNPGLTSLPGFFFSNATGATSVLQAPAMYDFLQPNTRLGEEDSEIDAAESPTSTLSTAEGGYLVGSPTTDLAAAETMNVTFAPFLKLGESTEAGQWIYPLLGQPFFEDDTSYMLQGTLPEYSYFFKQHMPGSLEELLQSTRGPIGKPEKWADPEYGKFCGTVDRCSRWELSSIGKRLLASRESLAPDYRFINLPSPSPKSLASLADGASVQWNDEDQFDLETLPYDELDAYMHDDGIDYYHLRKRRSQKATKARVPPSEPSQRLAAARPSKVPTEIARRQRFGVKIEFLRKKRPLTAYPVTGDDFIRTPGDEGDDDSWKSEGVRLMAFVVVKTLLGGLGGVMDWGILMRLFPSMSVSQLRRFWTTAKKDRQSTIVALTDKFRKAFIKAYADGELPSIDFDHAEDYDWKLVIEWACGLEKITDPSVCLPATREALDARYHISERQAKDREWRERYFTSTRSVFNRFQDATSEPMALPVDRATEEISLDAKLLTVAMSWVRALCVTREDVYSDDAVARKLESLCGLEPERVESLLSRAHRQLQMDAVVTKSKLRYPNERNWRLNQRVIALLEKTSKVDQFAEATAYKRELDEAFLAGEKKRVTYITDDGMIMALINLQAHGRICVETTGQPQVALGHEPGNYETRKYPKRYHHFRLDISPTDNYVYNNDPSMVDLRNRIKASDPPTVGEDGATPIWCDLFGKLDRERWLKYLGMVLFHLASRGSMRAKELAKSLKVALMVFEAQLILDWGEKLGIIGAPLPGLAPAVKEWWWIAIDAQKEMLEASRPRKKLPSSRKGDAPDIG